MIVYPATFTEDKKDGGYTVEFPDLPGCITEGDTIEEALENARDVLSLYLESIDSRKLPIPKPSHKKGKNVYYIEPEKHVDFAIWLKLTREEQKLTQIKLAKSLGISQQAYQKYEDPKKTNPSLNTIVKLEKIFGKSILIPMYQSDFAEKLNLISGEVVEKKKNNLTLVANHRFDPGKKSSNSGKSKRLVKTKK
nr:type II toxin-antitoxin system HicB family antitoxin [Leptospira alexanderi]